MTAAENFTSKFFRKYNLTVGENLEIRYPASAFITIESSEQRKNGIFSIGYAYEDITEVSEFEEVALREDEQYTAVEKEEEVPYVLTTQFFLSLLVVSVVCSLLILFVIVCVLLFRSYKKGLNKVIIIQDNKDQKSITSNDPTPSSRPFVVEGLYDVGGTPGGSPRRDLKQKQDNVNY